MNVAPRGSRYFKIENTADNIYNIIDKASVDIKVLDDGIIVIDSGFDPDIYLTGRRQDLT